MGSCIFDPPAEHDALGGADRGDRYMRLHLELKKMGMARRDMLIFSFWPGTVVLMARIVMAQSHRSTGCDTDLYDCHPFFLQGYATMADGENTAFGPNREFLMSRGFPGCNGYRSDSEIFTHSLHFTISQMGLDISAFKHVITPLDECSLNAHPDARFLTQLKFACRTTPSL